MDAKRIWTDEETLAFVEFMEDMVVEGVRADAGQFKPGVFNKLAAKMNERFPIRQITPSHCKNKHKRLKEKFQSAWDMINQSGFGWDDANQCVQVDSKSVLEKYLAAHQNRKYTPGKPFPLYPRLEKIFGKDRASGVYAMDGNAAMGKMPMEEESIPEDASFNLPITPEESATEFSPPPNASFASEKGRVRNPSTTKRARETALMDKFAETVQIAFEKQREHVQVLAKAISGVNDESYLGNTLEELGLNEQDVVRVAMKFKHNRELEKTFWSLKAEQRKTFLAFVMQEGP